MTTHAEILDSPGGSFGRAGGGQDLGRLQPTLRAWRVFRQRNAGWNGRNMRILPSGKRLHNYGKSPFFMGKSTINGAILQVLDASVIYLGKL